MWATGVGGIRTRQVSFSPDFLDNEAAQIFSKPAGLDLRRGEPRVDFGLACLTQAHEYALSHGSPATSCTSICYVKIS